MADVKELLEKVKEDTKETEGFFEKFGVDFTRVIVKKKDNDEGRFADGFDLGDEHHNLFSIAQALVDEGKLPENSDEYKDGVYLKVADDYDLVIAVCIGVICTRSDERSTILHYTQNACTWLKGKPHPVQNAFVKAMSMQHIREFNITKVPGFMKIVNSVREQLKGGWTSEPLSYFQGIALGCLASGRPIHEMKTTHRGDYADLITTWYYLFGSEDEAVSKLQDVREVYHAAQVVRG
jgi:hypothetical protein